MELCELYISRKVLFFDSLSVQVGVCLCSCHLLYSILHKKDIDVMEHDWRKTMKLVKVLQGAAEESGFV